MMNDPTKRETAAKASRKVERKPSDFFTWSACWAAATSLVIASRPWGSTGASAATSWGRDRLLAALTEMTSNSPTRCSTRWAVGTSQRANLAPAGFGRVLGRELLGGADLGVGLAVDLGEEVVEGVGQRVGQHERAGHEAHAEDDRQGGERQPQLVGQQALDHDPAHWAPLLTIR